MDGKARGVGFVGDVEDFPPIGKAKHLGDGRTERAGICADGVQHGKANRLQHKTGAKRARGDKSLNQGDMVARSCTQRRRCQTTNASADDAYG